MKIMIDYYKVLILLIFSSLFISCGRTLDTVNCFPNAPINVTIPLNSYINYQTNLQNNQWTYVDLEGSGTRGLIIVKIGANNYKAYDRNAPHICPDQNTTLSVQYPTVICPKDQAKWIITTGEPSEVSPLPLKNYPCNYNAATNTITIYN